MFKPRVLVVDADRHYREQLMYALEENYQLFDAEDRETALNYLEEEIRPDIVLTDLYLPPRLAYTNEGLSLLQQFKELAPEVKIIIVTAEERREIMAKCRELGADDYIVKPFEVGDLKNAIDRLIPTIPEGMERRSYWREIDGRQMGVERRRHRRVECEIPIYYALQEGEPSTTGKSRTINMSATGLLFPADQSVTPRSPLDLELYLQSEPPVVRARGEVRWARKTEERYNIGVQFMEIKEEDRRRIAEYIYS